MYDKLGNRPIKVMTAIGYPGSGKSTTGIMFWADPIGTKTPNKILVLDADGGMEHLKGIFQFDTIDLRALVEKSKGKKDLMDVFMETIHSLNAGQYDQIVIDTWGSIAPYKRIVKYLKEVDKISYNEAAYYAPDVKDWVTKRINTLKAVCETLFIIDHAKEGYNKDVGKKTKIPVGIGASTEAQSDVYMILHRPKDPNPEGNIVKPGRYWIEIAKSRLTCLHTHDADGKPLEEHVLRDILPKIIMSESKNPSASELVNRMRKMLKTPMVSYGKLDDDIVRPELTEEEKQMALLTAQTEATHAEIALEEERNIKVIEQAQLNMHVKLQKVGWTWGMTALLAKIKMEGLEEKLKTLVGINEVVEFFTIKLVESKKQQAQLPAPKEGEDNGS